MNATSTLYAIGDIHGHIELLTAAHALIARDKQSCGNTQAPIIHVGDFVDRGPDSKAVLDQLIEGQARGENWVTLKGNHDRLFSMFLDDPHAVDPRLRPDYTWLHANMGGRVTLASYGVNVGEGRTPAQMHTEALRTVPKAHQDFLHALPLFHKAGDCVFVHAGLRPGVALEHQAEDDLVWIRGDFHHDRRDHGALIVHGHSSIGCATHYGNRVNIDSGAAWGGPLSAVVITGRSVWLLTDTGRQPLPMVA